jgi:hypothetical protein
MITGSTIWFESATGNSTIRRLVNRATFEASGTFEGLMILP